MTEPLRPRGVAVLGATGSIGRSAASVLAAHPECFRTAALAAHRSGEALAAVAARLHPAVTLLTSESGDDALVELVLRDDVDTVLCAMTGVVGVAPVIAALRAAWGI